VTGRSRAAARGLALGAALGAALATGAAPLPAALGAAAAPQGHTPSPVDWPTPTADSRPWTRWWWLGSAVDEDGLTRQLEQLAAAGFGGVEICPIYGAAGFEDRYVPFLSPRFAALVAHAAREAKLLSLRYDLTTGTGWPFGGPNVTPADASSSLVLDRQELAGGEKPRPWPEGRVSCVLAVSDAGERVTLTDRIGAGGALDWTAPAGRWRVYAALLRGPAQQVKRAAPGGEGNVLDPFSPPALERYLRRFDDAFAGFRGEPPRAQFHDSFEYYGASATPLVFDEFARRRGYDLRGELAALAGDGPAGQAARVRADYRATLAELHLEYVERWTAWAHAHGSLTRNQAHGAPANLVDVYAAADIPETEVFGSRDEAQLPLLKVAASAAHLGGRPLASAEAFTWLGEHFQVPLSQLRPAADWLFLAGVNQLVFHGVPYSPPRSPWPGWQFYASVNFGPQGGLWRDLPQLNAYLARCQSILQSGAPDEDVLLYYPLQDAFRAPGALIVPSPSTPSFQAAGLALSGGGYAWDAVSDRFLAAASVASGRVRIGAGLYGAIVVPAVEALPDATARRLAELERAGATVLAGPDALERLARAPVAREPMADAGLSFVRRRHEGGRHYFVVNRGPAAVERWVALGSPARAVARLDPVAGTPGGLLPLRPGASGRPEVYLELGPGESAVLRSFAEAPAAAPPWPAFDPAGETVPLDGVWRVSFVEGGPALPAAFETRTLGSWTERGGEAERFAGTARYAITFGAPPGRPDDWQLELGRVAETARVRLNGRDLGLLWTTPFRVRLAGALRPGENRLEVDVSNLAANRVRDLDRRGERWKYFHDANVVGRDYKPLDASKWPVRNSGLLGPVVLRPLRARR
jgi:hypothetical protein